MHRIHIIIFILFSWTFANYGLSFDALSDETQSKTWLTCDIGVISPASEKILTSAINKVQKEGLRGLILIIDTPGGSLDSTRSMVKAIMSVEFPVVAWVGPGGSHAGSAGAFITLASHLAFMAPGTNIGAAHPINAFQGFSGGDKNTDQEVLEEKILQDTLAFMDSIALKRNRDREVAASFISRSVALTAEEALSNKIIDFMAPNLNSLMAQLNTREIVLDNEKKLKINTEGYQLASYDRSLGENVLNIFANPNLLYLFFIIGMTGLMWEITHPGSFFPGIIGVISIILAMISSSVLPVSWGALGLMILGIALMITEIFVPGFGIIGIGGFVAFFLGSVFLVDPSGISGLQVAWGTIIPGALFIGASALVIAYLVLKSQRKRPATGTQNFIGRTCTALHDFTDSGEGKVMIDGEIWNAKTDDKTGPILKDESLRIIAEKNLWVQVVRTDLYNVP